MSIVHTVYVCIATVNSWCNYFSKGVGDGAMMRVLCAPRICGIFKAKLLKTNSLNRHGLKLNVPKEI